MPELKYQRAPSPKPGRIDVWAEANGERVSELELLDMPTRLARATIWTAGIANVFTHEAHRRNGYAKALMEHTHEHLRHEGYAMAALFGIPGFYPQFGYATIGCDFRLEVETRVAEQARGQHRVQPARQRDLPAVARIFNAANQHLNGSIVRDPARWTGLRFGSTLLGTKGLSVAVDPQDQPLGFIAIAARPTEVNVTDGAFRDPAVAPSLVAQAVAEAVKRRVETIGFHLHPEFGLGSYVRRLDSRLTSVRTHDARYMARILDQDTLLAAVEPALRARAAAYGGKAPARLRIRTALGTTTLRLKSRGDERTISLPPRRLTQLLFGYWSAAEVATAAGVRVAKQDLPWLAALFPRGDAFCYGTDEY